MQQQLAFPNFHFKPKEQMTEIQTASCKSIKYDSVISSILTQASPSELSSDRLLQSKSKQQAFKNIHPTFKPQAISSRGGQPNQRPLKKTHFEVIKMVHQSHQNTPTMKSMSKGLLNKTKSLYDQSKFTAKPSVELEKQKSVATLKPKSYLMPRLLLLSPEKTLEKTDNSHSLICFTIPTKSKQTRRRNLHLTKERQRWNLENKGVLAEREESLAEISLKIDSLFSTQVELKTQKADNEKILIDFETEKRRL